MSDSLLSLAPHRIVEDALRGGSSHGSTTLFDRGLNEPALFFGASFDAEHHQEDFGSDSIEREHPDGEYLHAGNLPAEEGDDDYYYFMEDLLDDGEDDSVEVRDSSGLSADLLFFARVDHAVNMQAEIEDHHGDFYDAQSCCGSGHRESFRKAPRRQGRLSIQRK